jgi:hypothetical protein
MSPENKFHGGRRGSNPSDNLARSGLLHTSHYLSKGIQENSQLFPGAKNIMAKVLSRNDNRSNK